MNIAILSALPLDPPRGGAEIVAARMARGLRDAGHAVNVVTHSPIDQSIGSERPDWVITHNVRGLGWLLPRKIRRLGLKHIHVLHDIQLIEPSGLAYGDLRPTPVRRAWAALMRWMWGSPEIVIGPSQWILDVHRQWGFFRNSKLVHLQNPVGVTPLTTLFKRGMSDATPSLEKGGFGRGIPRRFVYLGQLEPHKGVFELVDAVRALPKDVRVEFVGDGSAGDELKRRTAGDPRFIFRGRVKPEDVPGVLAGALATVVPSRCLENAPMTITQSLAVGIPVIATSVGGVPELVKDGQNGLLVPPGDVHALTRAMQSVADGKRLTVAMAGMGIPEYCSRLISLVTPPHPPFLS